MRMRQRCDVFCFLTVTSCIFSFCSGWDECRCIQAWLALGAASCTFRETFVDRGVGPFPENMLYWRLPLEEWTHARSICDDMCLLFVCCFFDALVNCERQVKVATSRGFCPGWGLCVKFPRDAKCQSKCIFGDGMKQKVTRPIMQFCMDFRIFIKENTKICGLSLGSFQLGSNRGPESQTLCRCQYQGMSVNMSILFGGMVYYTVPYISCRNSWLKLVENVKLAQGRTAHQR